MNPAEAQVLLSMCAAYDNRKPDPDAAKAWAAALQGLRFDDCRQAVIEHYRANDAWLMPSMVRTLVRRIRDKRIADHPPVVPPPGLSDVEELAWLGRTRRRIGDGEVIDSDAAYQLVTGSVRELLAAATRTKEVPQ